MTLLIEMLKLALRSLLVKRLRTVLTMLGIVVGVGSVIVMLAYGEGTRVEMLAHFDQWGAKQLDARFQYGTWFLDNPAPRSERLTHGDIEAIRRECSAVRRVVPYTRDYGVSISCRTTDLDDVMVIATEPEYFSITESEFTEGEAFTHEQNLMRERVCVLTYSIKEELFFAADAVDNFLSIDGRRFRIVGVMVDREYRGGRVRRELYVPFHTANERMEGFGMIDRLTLEATETKYIQLAERQVRELLHLRHPKIPPSEDPDDPRKDPIYVYSIETWRGEREQIVESFSRLLIVIGALSLLIGGVGVMNIMLVTVRERTQEIGLRKAMGATAGHILTQFLAEAVTICVIGGALGIFGAVVACRYIERLPVELQYPDPLVTPAVIVIAAAVTVGVGLFFGVYPATRAARLDPILALHYE